MQIPLCDVHTALTDCLQERARKRIGDGDACVRAAAKRRGGPGTGGVDGGGRRLDRVPVQHAVPRISGPFRAGVLAVANCLRLDSIDESESNASL